MKQRSGALADYGQAITLDPKNAWAYTNRGLLHREMKRYGQALADYEQAIAIDSRQWQAWTNKGLLLCETNRSAEGLRALRRALSLAPDRHKSQLAAEIKRRQSKR